MRLKRIINDYNRMGGEIYYRRDKYEHDPELLDAYECGYEDAIREMSDDYSERRGNVTHYGAGGRVLYRHEPNRDMWDDGEIEYRRRRRANGQFY